MPLGLLAVLFYVFLEIFVLVQVSAALGGWPVIGLLALSFLAGSFILQRNRTFGLSGGNPLHFIFSSMAAVLFIVPGFVSDFMAILLLIPQFQRFVSVRSGEYFMRQNGFTRVFRFGGAGWDGMQGPEKTQGAEVRREVKVTVMDSEGNPAGEQHVQSHRRIDESSIIDVNPEEK